MIENLENRVLLTSTLVNGTLTLTTTTLGEHFVVGATATTVAVDIQGENFHFTYPTGSVKRLVILSNQNGNDTNRSGDRITVASSVTFPATITGSHAGDTIMAGSGPSSIEGGDGADYIVGGIGNDTIHGGDGRPAVTSNGITTPSADDTIFGGAGNDSLFGDGGPDAATLGDIIMGQAGNDTIEGGAGADLMDGGDGVDVLSYQDKGGDGVDVRFRTHDAMSMLPNLNYNAPQNFDYDSTKALAANNYPYTGFGSVVVKNQVYVVDEADNLFGNLDAFIAGLDVNPFTQLPDFDYNTILGSFALLNNDNFEQLWGGPGLDYFDVSIKSIGYTLVGGDGVDTLTGGAGDDLINGGPNSGPGRGGMGGQEMLSGGLGDDTINGGAGSDNIQGGDGKDSLSGDDGSDFLTGGPGDDWLDGGAGDDLMTGDLGDASHDTTAAGGGNDTMVGGAENNGADTLQGDGGFDVADYSLRTQNVKITFDIEHDDGNPRANGGQGERDLVTESTEAAIGGSGNDTLGSGDDGIGRKIDGGPGNDKLISGQGPDTIIGGPGSDSVDYTGRTNPITVTFDDLPNDGDPTLDNGGPPGENDNVDDTVETVVTDDTGGGGGGVIVTVPPDAPSNLVATALSESAIKLKWRDNARNEDGFIVARRKKTDSDYTVVTTLGSNTTQYIDTGLEPETNYVYRVRAFNTFGDSAYSDFAQAKTLPPAEVVAASGLVARSQSSTRIDLTWRDNSNNETKFEVWRQQTSVGTWDQIATLAAGSKAYSDQALTPSTQYGYQVRAANEFKSASFSNTAVATTKAASFIIAPTGLSAKVSAHGAVTLRWTDNSDNETAFAIERAPAATSKFTEIAAAAANQTTFTDTTAASGGIYLYRVRGRNLAGESGYSNVATSDLARALGTPTRFEALAVGSDTILLSWRENALIETAYIIERRFGTTGDWSVVGQAPANSDSYTDSKLVPDQQYGYRIRATDGTNYSGYSRIATETTLPLLARVPRAPTAPKVKAIAAGSARLWWRDNSNNETSFSIERARSLDGPFAIVDTVAADRTSWTDSQLKPNTRYYYRVWARTGTVRSLPTRIVAVTTLMPVKVSIAASDASGSEPTNPMSFTVTRKGGTAGALIVHYRASGSAGNGSDYHTLNGVVTIPDGKRSAPILVRPIDDKTVEGPELVVLSLVRSDMHKISPSLASATAELADDEIVPLGVRSSSPFSRMPVKSQVGELSELL